MRDDADDTYLARISRAVSHHEPTIRRVDAWHWRASCTCGYRSKHWDSRGEADEAVRTHLAREAQARRRQERREHRTAMTPRRFV